MESICTIKDIYTTLYQFEKSFADANNITINEAMVLCCLKDGESKTAGAISEYIGLSNSRISKILTSVENKEFITRSISQEDKRQMIFTLSPIGMQKIQEMSKVDHCFEQLFSKFEALLKKK